MFGLGFFATIKFVEYVAVICMIVVTIRSVMSIFGWATAFGFLGRAKKGFSASTVGSDKKSGALRWTLD